MSELIEYTVKLKVDPEVQNNLYRVVTTNGTTVWWAGAFLKDAGIEFPEPLEVGDIVTMGNLAALVDKDPFQYEVRAIVGTKAWVECITPMPGKPSERIMFVDSLKKVGPPVDDESDQIRAGDRVKWDADSDPDRVWAVHEVYPDGRNCALQWRQTARLSGLTKVAGGG